MDRYTGNPFLRLLECYVLDAIGQLDPKQRETLRLMEPKLVSIYGMKGTWLQIVQAQMGFPNDLPGKIRALWDRNVAKARAARTEIDPQQFVEAFVDDNFPDAGED